MVSYKGRVKHHRGWEDCTSDGRTVHQMGGQYIRYLKKEEEPRIPIRGNDDEAG